jgi:pimeloyl-ACP methyl ester carboxylesterase
MELVVDGRKAYAYTGGKPFDAGLPCVVFIHGAMHDHSVWTLLARWCAHHGFSVLALDQPGHGRSDGPPLPSVEALADWTLALLDATGVRQADFVGHSMGSLVGLEAAARAPQRVSRLVLVATAYPMKVSDALFATAREQPLRAIDMVNVFSHSSIASKPSFPGPGMWLHGSNRALMRRMLAGAPGLDGSNLFEHDFRVCDRYANGLQAAARVRCPVTFVLGERDQMTTPKNTRDIAGALRAHIVTLPAGHTLMRAARSYGAHDLGTYAWQIHLPDITGLLRAIGPVLERRVAESPFAGLTREVQLCFFRESVRLTFAAGRLADVAADGPAEGEINLPPQAFTPLVLGQKSIEELRTAYPDVHVGREWRLLLETLFPRMAGFIYSPY